MVNILSSKVILKIKNFRQDVAAKLFHFDFSDTVMRLGNNPGYDGPSGLNILSGIINNGLIPRWL